MNIESIGGLGSSIPGLKGIMGKGILPPEIAAKMPDLEGLNLNGDNVKFAPESKEIPLGDTTLPTISNNKSSFAVTLKELVSEVNDMQIEAGNKTEMFIKGDPIDLHDVMIAANKAKTSFQLLLELRNKGLDLYREVSRMQ